MGAPYKQNPDVKWITDKDGNVLGYTNEQGLYVALDSAYQTSIEADVAPYPAMIGPTQLIGSALTGTYPFQFMETFWEAIRRKSCKVCFLGDSVTENIAQNWPMGHWTIEFERELMRAFPDVAFEFVNISIGGKIALQVLGRAAGSPAPDTSLGASFVSHPSVEDANHYVRLTAIGSNSPTNPETWQGAAAGTPAWGTGEVWINRIAPHNFDLMTLCFGLNEENYTGNWWFAAAVQAIISNVRTHSTFNNYSRPSIICATPYNDTIARPLRNRLAEQMFAVAQKNGCPLIDGNRWDGIAVEGKDRTRQRWYGEAMYRYLVGSKNDNTIQANASTYWDILGNPNTGAGGTATDYISSGNARLRLLRKKLSRDVQLFFPINGNSGGPPTDGIVSLWYRVDPANLSVGYELKYQSNGTLTLLYHDGTTDFTIFTKSCFALNAVSIPYSIYLRAVGAVHECWTVFGATEPATGYDPKSLQLQFRVIHAGSEVGMQVKSDIFREGWCGIELNSVGSLYPALRTGNYSTQAPMLQFGYPLPVHDNGLVDSYDMNGRRSVHPNYQPNTDFIYDGDDPGGNTINHLTTDAYSLVYAAAIGPVIRQLAMSRKDVVTLGSSGVAIVAPANTAENSLAQVFIPAGSLGKHSELRISAIYSFTGSVNSKTANIKFGPSQASASSVLAQSTASAGNVAYVLETVVKARNDYKKQVRLAVAGLGTSTVAPSEITVDTTVDNYVYFTCTKATGGETMTLERYTLQLVGG